MVSLCLAHFLSSSKSFLHQSHIEQLFQITGSNRPYLCTLVTMPKRAITKQSTPTKRNKHNISQTEPSTPLKNHTNIDTNTESNFVTPVKSTLPRTVSQYNLSGQQHNLLPSVSEIVAQLLYIKQLQPTQYNDTDILFTLPVPNDFNLATTICSFGFFRLTPAFWIPSPTYYSSDKHPAYIVCSIHGSTGTSAKNDFATFDMSAESELQPSQYWTRDVGGTFVRSYNYGSEMQHVIWLAIAQVEVGDDDSSKQSLHNNNDTLYNCLSDAAHSKKHIIVKQLLQPTKPPKSLSELEYTDTVQLSDTDLATVIQQVIRMLRLYDDFKHYNELLDKLGVRNQVVKNLGKVNYLTRLYRAPTLWEDMCKAQLVTNITWSRTVQCCNLLCQHVSIDGVSWPTPYDIIRVGVPYLEQKCNVGYRAERLVRLANTFINDKLETKLTDMSNDHTVSTHTLYKQVLSLYGFGAFAANNVVQLLGRYDVVPSDSETARHIKLVNNMAKTTKLDMKQVDKLYEQRYAKFAPYQYLIYWSELWYAYERHLLAATAAYQKPTLVTMESIEARKQSKRSTVT